MGKGILLTTHTMATAEELCDRIGIIDRGVLLAEGTYDKLREMVGKAKNLEEVFLTLTSKGMSK